MPSPPWQYIRRALGLWETASWYKVSIQRFTEGVEGTRMYLCICKYFCSALWGNYGRERVFIHGLVRAFCHVLKSLLLRGWRLVADVCWECDHIVLSPEYSRSCVFLLSFRCDFGLDGSNVSASNRKDDFHNDFWLCQRGLQYPRPCGRSAIIYPSCVRAHMFVWQYWGRSLKSNSHLNIRISLRRWEGHWSMCVTRMSLW